MSTRRGDRDSAGVHLSKPVYWPWSAIYGVVGLVLVGIAWVVASTDVGWQRVTPAQAPLREENATLAGAAARTTMGAARRVNPSLRSEIRLHGRRIAQLHPFESSKVASSFAVHLEDLSFGGFRIRSRQRLSSGDQYEVDLYGHNTFSSPAEVRWVQRRGGLYVAGLKFKRQAELKVQQ
jgi:hypothetical protein